MSNPARCVILGAGGHAAVLIETMLRGGNLRPDCLIDRDTSRWSTEICGIPIVGGDDMLDAIRLRGVHYFAVGVGRTKVEDRRQLLFEGALSVGLRPVSVVDSTAVVSPTADVGDGAQVLVRAVINARARVGRNAVINTGAIIEHDCYVGDHAFVGSGAVLAGSARVGAGCFVGAGAILLPGVAVGAGALVGAGAVVLEPVDPGETVVGVPARNRDFGR